ncbi:hypothetical protein FI667_g2471, partial [Globisporangium splendens]
MGRVRRQLTRDGARRGGAGPRRASLRAAAVVLFVATALAAVAATHRSGSREGRRAPVAGPVSAQASVEVKVSLLDNIQDDGSGSFSTSSGSDSGSGSGAGDEITFPCGSSSSSLDSSVDGGAEVEFPSSSTSSSDSSVAGDADIEFPSSPSSSSDSSVAGDADIGLPTRPASHMYPVSGPTIGIDDDKPDPAEDWDVPDPSAPPRSSYENGKTPVPPKTKFTSALNVFPTPVPTTSIPALVVEERTWVTSAPTPTPTVTQKPATAAPTPVPTTAGATEEASSNACSTAGELFVFSPARSFCVSTLSLVASNSSLDGSSSGATMESIIIVADDTTSARSSESTTVITPYSSDYCRCKVTECQNQYPGNSTGTMCEASVAGTCRAGYKMCVSTDSYKLEVQPTTPSSVADITFTLLASDIVGAFHNLGDQNPLNRGSNWWVTISLPSSWRFVTWEMTSVEATMTGLQNQNAMTRTSQIRPCSSVTAKSNCPSEQSRTPVGFINVMDLLEDGQNLMSLISKAPILFKLKKSVISGPNGGSSASMSVILTYEKTSGALASTSTARRMREVSVDVLSEFSSVAGTNLAAMELVSMDVPQINDGTVHSSLIWVDGDSSTLTLSFSTSTVIGNTSVDPKVCVNFRSSACRNKGRVPTANVTFQDLARAAYMKDGNPFINLYSLPGDAYLEIQPVNETYFCIEKLLPTGAGTNTTWEINSDFTFQLQIAGIMWSQSNVVANTTGRFPLPVLAEVTLMDQDALQGSDCAQLLAHESTSSNHGLSVYSVMSVTIYSVALVGAILITRMNGITFSGSSFFNDMTSIMVLLVLILGIIGNAIWIHVSSDALNTNSSHIYYVLRQITMCCTWTMMISVCFHWLLVLSESLRKMRRVYVLLAYIVMNGGYYTYVLYSMITLTDFFKCTYNDYLKNPRYTKRLCDSDYCPDLQPYQWKYATEEVCKYVHDSSWYFPGVYGGDVMIFATAIVLLILGAYVIRRGSRLIQHSGDIFDDRITSVMKKSLWTYLAVIVAISFTLGLSCIMNLLLYTQNWKINAVVWYVFTIWLPTLIPPAGFLVLQWNPRLHGMNWNPSLHVKERSATKDNLGEKGWADGKMDNLSETWTGISNFPDTEYAPIGAESIDGNQNVLALSIQLASKVPIAHACFVELYVADLNENDVTGEDIFEDLPSAVRHRSSISSLLQTGIQHDSLMNKRGQSVSLRASLIGMNTSNWVRVGFTETVLPTLIQDAESPISSSTQIATFLSVLQVPVMPSNPVLRFVVYELPDGIETSPTSDQLSLERPTFSRRSSSMQLDERARHARVSGMGLAPPTRPQVFCEFTCSASEILASDEMSLIARDGSHRRYVANAAFSDIPESPSPSTSEPPQLRIKSMTVSTRTLKENNGFYITKSFQFAEGNDMVVEDMTESVFTNEVPRQYLELLRTERAEDLAHARADLADFETKCKAGLVGGLYDNLIDQIQGENDQTVVQSWLQDRVQRRRMYVDALRECHQVCIDRAEAGVNFKASTEKKSLVLRFLPINLHVQDMWVGPTADLRSQRTRRTSPNVKAYPTITVGAFAAHCYKFRHAGSILSLRSKLQKRTLSRLHSDQSDRGGSGVDNDQMDWTKAEVRSHDEILWQLTTRMDMCVSQALTALVTSFCRCLELALQHPTDRQFLQLIDSIGFLFQVESLLSTQGKEIGMLEDFSGSVEAMKNVTFVLDTSPPRHLPSTLNLHLKNTNLPSVVSVRVSKGAASGAYIVVVGIRCKEEVLAHLPKNLRNGGSISVTPVMFTQGINEMQTLANNASGKKTNLQDTINQKSFRVLAGYIDKYTMLATKQPDAVPTPVSTILPLLVSLEERIKTAKKQVVKTKQTKIIQESSRLCRLLGAGRVTSCKSAKDRTGMSVTLEQIQLLSEHHGLPQEFVIRTVSTMRSNGVRLENAFKNTGKRQYAFNALQRSLLPEEYKCPEGTYGRGQVS